MKREITINRCVIGTGSVGRSGNTDFGVLHGEEVFRLVQDKVSWQSTLPHLTDSILQFRSAAKNDDKLESFRFFLPVQGERYAFVQCRKHQARGVNFLSQVLFLEQEDMKVLQYNPMLVAEHFERFAGDDVCAPILLDVDSEEIRNRQAAWIGRGYDQLRREMSSYTLREMLRSLDLGNRTVFRGNVDSQVFFQWLVSSLPLRLRRNFTFCSVPGLSVGLERFSFLGIPDRPGYSNLLGSDALQGMTTVDPAKPSASTNDSRWSRYLFKTLDRVIFNPTDEKERAAMLGAWAGMAGNGTLDELESAPSGEDTLLGTLTLQRNPGWGKYDLAILWAGMDQQRKSDAPLTPGQIAEVIRAVTSWCTDSFARIRVGDTQHRALVVIIEYLHSSDLDKITVIHKARALVRRYGVGALARSNLFWMLQLFKKIVVDDPVFLNLARLAVDRVWGEKRPPSLSPLTVALHGCLEPGPEKGARVMNWNKALLMLSNLEWFLGRFFRLGGEPVPTMAETLSQARTWVDYRARNKGPWSEPDTKLIQDIRDTLARIEASNGGQRSGA